MMRPIQELAVIVICAALIGVPIGLWITGSVPPVSEWGTK